VAVALTGPAELGDDDIAFVTEDADQAQAAVAEGLRPAV